MRDTERERERERERGRHRQREEQVPAAGLDPRNPGSRPEPKTVAQPLSHPGTPLQGTLSKLFLHSFIGLVVPH